MTMFLAIIGLAAMQPESTTVPIDAATVASAIQPRLPQRFAPDVSMVGAAAEGNVLVLSYEISNAAIASVTPEALSLRFSAGFCAAPGGAELLAGPMNLRADARSPDGRTVRGVTIETCPLAQDLPLPVPTRD